MNHKRVLHRRDVINLLMILVDHQPRIRDPWWRMWKKLREGHRPVPVRSRSSFDKSMDEPSQSTSMPTPPWPISSGRSRRGPTLTPPSRGWHSAVRIWTKEQDLCRLTGLWTCLILIWMWGYVEVFNCKQYFLLTSPFFIFFPFFSILFLSFLFWNLFSFAVPYFLPLFGFTFPNFFPFLGFTLFKGLITYSIPSNLRHLLVWFTIFIYSNFSSIRGNDHDCRYLHWPKC